VELEEKEAEYIQQLNEKVIDVEKFRELIGELDMQRAMGESVVEGPATMQATTQDKEVGESEREESTQEEPEVAAVVVESSTVRKGKWKAAPARAKVYAEMDGLVSNLTCRRLSALTYLLTVRPMLHAEDEAIVYHDATRAVVQEMPDRQEQVLLEGEEPRSHRGGGGHHPQEVKGGACEPGGRVVEWGRGAGSGGA
jgi:hypothetical protein